MASVTNPLSSGNPLPLPEAKQPASTLFLSRPIAWFRGEGLEGKEKLFRTIAAIACAILLSLTVVGGIFVILGAIEWTRQDQELSKKQEGKITAEAAKAFATKKAAEEAEAAKALAAKKAGEEAEAAKALAAKKAAEEAAEAAKALAAKKAAEEAEAAKALAAKKAAEEAEAAKALAAKKAAEEAEAAKALAAKQAVEAAEAAKALAAKKAAEEAEAAKALAAKKAAEEAEAAKALAAKKAAESEKTVPVALSVKPQLSNQDFPKPFEVLRQIKPDALLCKEEILQKVNQALKKGKNQVAVPNNYPKLQGAISSQEQLQGLYEEAKILAHLIAMREFGELVPKADQYKMTMYPYLDMLVSYLVKHKSFPQGPYQWADSL